MSSAERPAGGMRPLCERLQDRLYQLTFAIVQHGRRSQQIRTALLTAAKIGAMAAPAVGVVDRTAPRDDRGVCRIPLLRGKTGDASTPLRPEARAQQREDKCARTQRQRTPRT